MGRTGHSGSATRVVACAYLFCLLCFCFAVLWVDGQSTNLGRVQAFEAELKQETSQLGLPAPDLSPPDSPALEAQPRRQEPSDQQATHQPRPDQGEAKAADEAQQTGAIAAPATEGLSAGPVAKFPKLLSLLCQRGPVSSPTYLCSEERLQSATQALRPFPGFNLSDSTVLDFALLAHSYLAPWLPLDGRGPGAISPSILEAMSYKEFVMAGSCHIRIVKGKIFYRFPATVGWWWRFNRMVGTLVALRTVIEKFGLHGLSVEFFLNTQDQPISLDSTSKLSGYPVWSVEGRMDALDILYPDPLDLHGNYIDSSEDKHPWAEKKSVAFFRGGATCYPLHNDTNWRANPRFRLHKMTDVRPDLLDAKMVTFGEFKSLAPLFEKDGYVTAPRVQREKSNEYKYEVVVDGNEGTSRTCGVISSNSLMIRQDSPYHQFFAPLLKPYDHYLPTDRRFQDLFSQIDWARHNEKEVQRMVSNAHGVSQRVCNSEMRLLYLAILFVKYAREAMESPALVEVPQQLCTLPIFGNASSIRELNELYMALPNFPSYPVFSCEPPHPTNKSVMPWIQHSWLPMSTLDSLVEV